MNTILKFLLRIFFIGIIVFLFNKFFFQICIVQGDSMQPTLKNMNIVLVKKINVNLHQNDIVLIKKNNKIIIKRIVGTPNDKIFLDNYIYINDIKFDNIYTPNGNIEKTNFYLKSDEYFVLGDNRENSIDSRFNEIGIIKQNEIIGKVLFKK